MALVRDTWYGHYDESGNMYFSVQTASDPTYSGAITLTFTTTTSGFGTMVALKADMQKTSNFERTDTLNWFRMPFVSGTSSTGVLLLSEPIKIAVTDTGCGLPNKTTSFSVLAAPPDLKNFFF